MAENERSLSEWAGRFLLDRPYLHPPANFNIRLDQLARPWALTLRHLLRAETKFQPAGRVVPQRLATARRLWISEFDPDVRPLLIRPQEQSLLVHRCNSSECPGHHPGLRGYTIFLSRVFLHLLRRNERGDGIDCNYLQRLLLGVLGEEHHHCYRLF